MMAMKKAEKLSTLPHGAVIDTKPVGKEVRSFLLKTQDAKQIKV